MHLHITASDGVPIYQQIIEQIRNLVASGRLAPGEELPPIRALAEQLVVNANTVARAYRELGAAGILTNRRTAGTYVADDASSVACQQCLEVLAGRVDALLAEARQMNIATDEVLALVKQRDRANRPG